MDTVRELIEGALRLCGAIDPGEAPDPEESNDALGAFNDLLDSLAVESLLVPFTASAAYSTTAFQDTHTVGPGGNWNGDRPQDIRLANIRVAGVDTPLAKLSYIQYADIPVKNTPGRSTSFYYEPQYPLGRFVLYPVPDAAYEIIIAYDSLFQQVTLDTVVSTLPPGYRRMLRYNLALEIAPEYSKKAISEDVKKIAKESKSWIKSQNAGSLDAPVDTRVPGINQTAWDWRVG